jgi:hypothetical protein
MAAERRPRLQVVRYLVVLSIVASPAVGQPAEVLTDLRVESPSLTDPQISTVAVASETLRTSIAGLLAGLGREKFPYLTWKIAPAGGANGTRLVLVLKEENGACKPNTTTLELFANDQTSPLAHLLKGGFEFIENCDDSALAWSELNFSTKITDFVKPAFQDAQVLKRIQDDLLSTVVLTTILEVGEEQLFLPIGPQTLKADRRSKLLADYGDSGRLWMHPGREGVRTQMFIEQFQCKDINNRAQLPADGLPWPNDFAAFLDKCRQPPAVKMVEYHPLLDSELAQDPGGGQ